MGLSITTHFLVDMLEHDEEGAEWFREDLALVNQFLAENNLPAHVEATEARTQMETPVDGFPYSFLHYLRRAFAYVREGKELTSLGKGGDASRDAAIAAVTTRETHLLYHSDAEGFYVPVDFKEVIVDVNARGLRGGYLGSTQRLMGELIETAPALGISLLNGQLSSEQFATLSKGVDEEDGPYWRERLVWLTLFEAARVSLADRTLIVFS